MSGIDPIAAVGIMFSNTSERYRKIAAAKLREVPEYRRERVAEIAWLDFIKTESELLESLARLAKVESN